MNLPVQVPIATSLAAVEYTGQEPLTQNATRPYQEVPPAPCIPIEASAVNIHLPLHSQVRALVFLACPCRGLRLGLRRLSNPWPNLWICIPIPLYQWALLPHNQLSRYPATFHRAQKHLGERPIETGTTANSTYRRLCSLAFSTHAHPNVRNPAQRNFTTRRVERQGQTR
jgi:hypothetical protein